jgi:hypothetical protein
MLLTYQFRNIIAAAAAPLTVWVLCDDVLLALQLKVLVHDGTEPAAAAAAAATAAAMESSVKMFTIYRLWPSFPGSSSRCGCSLEKGQQRQPAASLAEPMM